MRAVASFVCLCAAVGPVSAQSWVPMTAPSTNIGPIACSADGSNLVLAGGAWNEEGGAVYVSHDSGATWTAASVPVAPWDAVASSADGTTLMAREFYGTLYTSSDSGATWKLNDLTNVSAAVACSADGTRLFAAAFLTNRSLGAIYASIDSGATWAPTAAPAAAWDPLACSADGTKVVAGEGANVWVSTNSGAAFGLAFTLGPPGIAAGEGPRCASVACSADGTTMMAGVATGNYSNYAGLATSADSGATWRWSSEAMPTNSVPWPWTWETVCCSTDGSRMAAAGQGGALAVGWLALSETFLSADAGASWAEAPPMPYTSGDPVDTPSCTGLAMSADGFTLLGVSMAGSYWSFTSDTASLKSTPVPRLAIGRAHRGLALSWIVPSVGFVLQQSPDLGTTNWTDVPGTPALDYSTLRNRVTVPAPAGQMFYRLISR